MSTGRCAAASAASRRPTTSPNPELLELPVTVLVPAAVQDQITEENAGRIRARMITEGANAAVSPEADPILHDRNIFLVPDIIANAGGVIVSYFEWVQDLQAFFWEEEEINTSCTTSSREPFTRSSTPRSTSGSTCGWPPMVGRSAGGQRDDSPRYISIKARGIRIPRGTPFGIQVARSRIDEPGPPGVNPGCSSTRLEGRGGSGSPRGTPFGIQVPGSRIDEPGPPE